MKVISSTEDGTGNDLLQLTLHELEGQLVRELERLNRRRAKLVRRAGSAARSDRR